jgi:hypothetical protein
MEKRAAVKQAGANIQAAIQASMAEHLENLKIAAHNERVRLGLPADPKPYQNAAFTNMIRAVDGLFKVALDEG